MRLLLRLAALHGQLEAGDGNRELIVTVAGGLGLRLAVQQVAKLVPVLGWVVSGLLSGLSTWLLGRAAVAYFDGSLRERVPALQRLPQPGRMRGAMGRLRKRGWVAITGGWKPTTRAFGRLPDAHQASDAMTRLKGWASGLGRQWITGLTSWTGRLRFRRRVENPPADREFRGSSLEEAN